MKVRINLKEFEKMYDSFDKGHDRNHLKEVRVMGLKLAKKYAPEKEEIVYVAATLHDIGLSKGRDGHEISGYEMIKNNTDIKNSYTNEEFEEILDAIKEHRASSGSPKTLVGKIISDADKSNSTSRSFTRAYEWGCKYLPQINHYGQLIRAAQHLYIKFGPNGSGIRVYFKETKEMQIKTYAPIFTALEKCDLSALNAFLDK